MPIFPALVINLALKKENVQFNCSHQSCLIPNSKTFTIKIHSLNQLLTLLTVI